MVRSPDEARVNAFYKAVRRSPRLHPRELSPPLTISLPHFFASSDPTLHQAEAHHRLRDAEIVAAKELARSWLAVPSVRS